MRFPVVLPFLLALGATASPIVATGTAGGTPDGVSIEELVARGATQLGPRKDSDANVTANEFLDSGCKDVVLLYARGSTQDGNIVRRFVSRRTHTS